MTTKEKQNKWVEKLKTELTQAPVDWREYLSELATLAASRSKDPSTKVGAVIYDPETHQVISIGYNGFPRGVHDLDSRWQDRPTKYLYVVHAEMNATLTAKQDLTGKALICTLEPCQECVKAIIQSGITEVCWLESRKNMISRTMMKEAGVTYERVY